MVQGGAGFEPTSATSLGVSLPFVRLFGDPALLRDGHPVPLGRRGRAALIVLAVEPSRRARRERLCGLLWPDRADVQARASLRQCLAELRSVTGGMVGADRECIWLEAGTYASDYEVLRAALAIGQAEPLTRALAAIGRAPLGDGLDLGEAFAEWLGVTRATLDRKLGDAAASVAAAALAEGDGAAALGLADAWLTRDPLDERVAAIAIRSERLAGAPAAARRRARALADALARDDLPPPGSRVAEALTEPLPKPARTAELPPSQPSTAAAPARPSIAVLPFGSSGENEVGRIFADGLAEDVALALTSFPSLFVVADRAGAGNFGGRAPYSTAKELGVRYLLDGSVRLTAGRARATVRLVDAVGGQQIWGDRFDGDSGDTLGLQDQVASAVASVVESVVVDAEMRRALIDRSPAPTAYDLTLRANAKLQVYDRGSIIEALALAEEAAELDPSYAWAVATAGFCNAALFMNCWADDPRAVRRRAQALINRALPIGRDDLLALPVVAGAILNIGGDTAQARMLIDRALELNGERAFTLFWAGWLELLSDCPEPALERFRKAQRLDPRSTYRPFQLTGMGNCLFLLGRFSEAEALQRETVALVPAYAPAHLVLAASLARLGRLEEGRRALTRGLAGASSSPPAIFRPPEQQALLRNALELLGEAGGERASAEPIPMTART